MKLRQYIWFYLGLTPLFILKVGCIRYGSDVKVFNNSKNGVCVASEYSDISGLKSGKKEVKYLAPKRELWLVNMMIGSHKVSAWPAKNKAACNTKTKLKAEYQVGVKKDKIQIVTVKEGDFKK